MTLRSLILWLNEISNWQSQSQVIEEILDVRRYFCVANDPFAPNAPFLYPLKTSENHKVF